MKEYDIVVIGGGSAGLSAALAAKKSGIDNIIILERENSLGGLLNQLIHNEFGMYTFNEKMTGPEYAQKFINEIMYENIVYKLNTTVLSIDDSKNILAVNNKEGILEIKAKAIILCCGCRERPRGIINIPGNIPAGIFSASTAQRFINIHGYMPGKEVVILGSGELGLLMARRMTLEGANVKSVIESLPYARGSIKNISQCLEDYNIPLALNKTIIGIKGGERLEGVTIVNINENKKPISGTEEFLSCDTLITSADLIPESEIFSQIAIEISVENGGVLIDESMRTAKEGFFACGDVVYVHGIVDYVTAEGNIAGQSAAEYILGKGLEESKVEIEKQEVIKFVVPKWINLSNEYESVDIRFEVKEKINNCYITLYFDDEKVIQFYKECVIPYKIETVRVEKFILKKYEKCKKIKLVIEENTI